MSIMSIITTIMASLNITTAALTPILGSIVLVFAGWTATSFVSFKRPSKYKEMETN